VNLGDLFGGSATCAGSDCDVYFLSQIWSVLSSVISWDIVSGVLVTLLALSLLRTVFGVLRLR
jgi:hypothetical protein